MCTRDFGTLIALLVLLLIAGTNIVSEEQGGSANQTRASSTVPNPPGTTAEGDPSGVQAAKGAQGEYQTESIRGRVVWQAEALERRFGIKTVPEAKERVLAIETTNGQIHPIFEDLRGRSFRTDRRLREMEVELLVRRHVGSPTVQVVRIHQIKDSKKHVVDYWCDVCAIVMFEMGPCACCQDDNRLRTRLAKEDE